MMKKTTMLILIIFIIVISSEKSYATEDYKIFFKETTKEHRSVNPIVGISVNSDDEVALGFTSKYSDHAYINVYDNKGNFIRGYSFQSSGSYSFKYGEMNNITVYFVRGGIVCIFDANAKLVKAFEFSDYEEERKYAASISNEKSVMANGNFYEINSTFFGYTRLTKTDAEGNVTIIYDNDIGRVYSTYLIITVAGFLLFSLFLIKYRKYAYSNRFTRRNRNNSEDLQ